MRNVAIFRFSPTEGPAYFADWLDARGIAWQLIALDEGAAVPADPRAFAGIGMMGGPMSVNDDAAVDGAAVRAAARRRRGRRPGDRPLPRRAAAGARRWARRSRARRSPRSAGSTSTCRRRGRAREWFGGRARFATFQWHYDAFALPAGATRVLTNRVQREPGVRRRRPHIGFQCHIEMTRDLVETWLATGAGELPRGVDAGAAVGRRHPPRSRRARRGAQRRRRRRLRALGAAPAR